jgi:AcrR family transcriptional regulator
MTEAVADGRRLRRANNRAAVIDALVALFDEGVYEPSSAQIAERAGLSPRSLFRYFDDVDDLTRAAIERELAAARPLLHVDARPDDSLERRIDALVDARVRLYEAIAPGARAGRICAHRNSAVAAHLREARAHWRREVARLFARELGTDAQAIATVDVACSFESYELLRHAHGLSRTAARAALVSSLTALLSSFGR